MARSCLHPPTGLATTFFENGTVRCSSWLSDPAKDEVEEKRKGATSLSLAPAAAGCLRVRHPLATGSWRRDYLILYQYCSPRRIFEHTYLLPTNLCAFFARSS